MENYAMKNLLKIAVMLLGLMFGLGAFAQMPMPDTYLNSWSFYDANDWTSDLGFPPVAFTNIESVTCWATNETILGDNALLLDSTNAAFLQYNVVETNGYVNLTCDSGTIWFWFSPDWSSLNQGGTGPGDWGRFIDVGAWTSNATYGWWSLYVSPDGDNIYFSGQTNGIGTNYLSYPISWTNYSRHLIGLNYTASNSMLYVDGLIATNGFGVSYWPGSSVLSNGFYIGSDYSGTEQARGEFVDIETYSDSSEWNSNYFCWYYTMAMPYLTNSGYLGGGGAGGGAMPEGIYAPAVVIASTNLWLAITNVVTNTANLFLSNTVADIQYEIQGKTSLASTQWVSEGFVFGSEITNWTLTSIAATNKPTLFLRVRSWIDDGSGLPDWWQLQYFGYLGVDPNGDPAGDGWSNLQKFQNGWNPNIFYTPPAPQGLTAVLNTVSNTATVSWQPSPGPVTGYTVEDSDGNTFNFSAGTNSFNDDTSSDFLADPWNQGDVDITFKIQAHYASGDSAWSAPVSVEQNMMIGHIVPGAQGTAYLAVSALPPNTTAIRLTVIDYYYLYFIDSSDSNAFTTTFDIPISDFTNGLYPLPNNMVPSDGNYRELWNYNWYGQAVGTNGHGLTATTWLTQDYTSPQDGFLNSWLVPPYFDGRSQLKQNLIFQLRAAVTDFPFQYTEEYAGDGSVPLNNPNNYAYASFYNFQLYYTDAGAAYQPFLDVFQPFEENYLDLNFAFNSSDLDSYGRTTTGAGGYYYGYSYEGGLTLQIPPTYQFVAPTTNGAGISAMLGTNQTRWLASFPIDSNPFYLTEIGITNYYETDGETYYNTYYAITPDARNLFGLLYLSDQITWGNSGGTVATLYSGSDVENNSGYFYPETAQPQFQIVGYDCWPAPNVYYDVFTNGTDYPGMAGLLINHTNSVLITSVGNSGFQLACYAKLEVENGYSGVYGFLEQYFDQAYTMTNGVATTNTTGVLSPYGNFFATQPGQTALVTMPDVDTGARGTCTVYSVSLQLDANHDGNMDLSFSGADATSPANPMRFWVNSGYSGVTGNAEVEGGVLPDYTFGNIVSQRDLENFARLWICGMPALPASQNYTVTLNWQNVSGNPGINLYNSVETNGGTGYLTSTNIAAQQSAITNVAGYGYGYYQIGSGVAIARITNGATFTFPASYFTNSGNKYFLFEGAGIGSGELTLTISDSNSNTIAQTGVWLDLHGVDDFFEQAVITNNMNGVRSNWTSTVEVVQPAVASASGNDTNLIVMVHGINVQYWDYLNDSETVYKRLYWAGFQGQFTAVKWPCNLLTPIPSPLTFSVFNLSELQAYKASTALTNYLKDLKTHFPGYKLNILAHSQGNAVVSEAIKNGLTFDTYILTQGALPANAYDATATNYLPFVAQETGSNITPKSQPMGYQGVYTNLTGRIVNFYNPNDGVLNIWKTDQIDEKPSAYYSYNGTNCWYTDFYFISHLVTDFQEMRSMVSRSRSLSIGQSGPASAHGVIQSAVDLNASFGFNSDISEHSAQWTRPIQTCLSYYSQILLQIQPAP